MIKAAYVYYHELKNTTESDVRALDVINVAFAHCRDSRLSFDHEEELVHLQRIKKANPSLRVMFSVGGWGSGGFSVMSSRESTRKEFADSCLEFIKKHELNGIDVDWEYPCLDWGNIDASPDDKHNFTLLLRCLRETFDSYDPSLMLTIAVGNDSYFIDNTEMDQVQKYLNYVSLMTYDMRGCGDRVTGHHTNLFAPKEIDVPRRHRSVEHSVRIYHQAGVPMKKLVIGIAFYSRMWKGVECTERNGLWQKAAPGNYGPSYGEIINEYFGQKGYACFYDEECEAPYLFNGDSLISFDNERSIQAKCSYVKNNSLCGVMYWEHSCDPSRTLLKVIQDFED